MRLFLTLAVLLFSLQSYSQTHTFRCLESEVFNPGCLTCDNTRTGKMITGIETTVSGTKRELLNPIIVKYDTSRQSVTLVDYRNVTSTLILANTAYDSMHLLLKALAVCQTPDGSAQYIDTLIYSGDTLYVSISGDSVKAKTVIIPSGGPGDTVRIDTFEIDIDTLRLSLSGDGELAKALYIGDLLADDQNLSFFVKSGANNQLTITDGTGVTITDGTNVTITRNSSSQITVNSTPVIDTADYVSDTLRLSISGDGQKYKSIYLPAGSGDTVKIDTFEIVADSLRLSISGDGQKYKRVSLIPYFNTDNQAFDTAKIENDTLILSIVEDATQAVRLSLKPYKDNTDGQKADTFWIANDTLYLSLSGDSVAVGKVSLSSYATGDDQSLILSAKSGTHIPLGISGGSGIFFKEGSLITLTRLGVDTMQIAATEVDGSVTNEGSLSVGAGGGNSSDIISNTSGSANVTISGGTGITVTEAGSTITVASTLVGVTDGDKGDVDVSGSGTTWSLDTNAVQTIDIQDQAVTYAKIQDVNANSFLGRSAGTSGVVSAVSIGSNQLAGRGSSGNITAISVGGILTFAGNTLNASEADGSVANEGTLGVGAGTGTTSVITSNTSGANGVTLTAAGSLTISESTSSNGGTITLTGAYDQLAVNNKTGGNTIPVGIINGNGIFLRDGTNMLLEKIGSDTIRFTSNAYLDTFSRTGDTIYASIFGDGRATNKIYSPSGTDSQSLSYGTKTGNDIPLNISGGGGVTITQGPNTLITRNSSSQITIEAEDDQLISMLTKSGANNTLEIIRGNQITITDGDNVVIDRNASNQITVNARPTIDTFRLNGNDLELSINGDQQAKKTISLAAFRLANNGLWINDDTIQWGSDVDWSGLGTELTRNTFIHQGTNSLTFQPTTSTRPHLSLRSNNDVWFGARDTSEAGSNSASLLPHLWFRHGQQGGFNFGLNTAARLNRLGSHGVNMGKNGEASGAQSKNFGEDGKALSIHSVNMARAGEASGDLYAFNTGAFGSATNFAAFNSGYDGDATNYYAVNMGRLGQAVGYHCFNAGQAGYVSGTDAKNFGYLGLVGGSDAIGFSNSNTTSGNYAMNGSRATTARAYGQSRWGYYGVDHTSQLGTAWQANDILFTIDNGKTDTSRASAITTTARGWTQLRDNNGTQINQTEAQNKPKAALEVVSSTSGVIVPGGTMTQRNTIWSESSQSGNFTPTFTKGWQDALGNNIMDQNGMQFQVLNPSGGGMLYALRHNGSGYYWNPLMRDTTYFYPENYGALVNDGTDDRTAIQAAIDAACNRGGGVVWLAKGEYTISSTAARTGSYNSGLHLCSNVTLMGQGWNSILRSTISTSGQHVLSMANGSANIKVVDLQIDPDSLNNGAAIYVHDGTFNLTIERVKIDRGTFWGIYIREASIGLIDNCDIQNMQNAGVDLYNCSRYVVRNNVIWSNASKTFHPSRGPGVLSRYNTAGTNRSYMNLITGNNIHLTGSGVEVWRDSLTKVVDNTIRLVIKQGILADTNNVGVQIQRNTIQGCGYSNNTSPGIEIDGGSKQMTVIGNRLDTIINTNAGFKGGVGILNSSAGAVIEGNTIRAAYIDGIKNNGNRCVISNNQVEDCSVLTVSGHHGIHNTGERATITGNNVHDTRGTPRMTSCIYNSNAAANSVIVANNASGSTGTKIDDLSTGSVKANNKE